MLPVDSSQLNIVRENIGYNMWNEYKFTTKSYLFYVNNHGNIQLPFNCNKESFGSFAFRCIADKPISPIIHLITTNNKIRNRFVFSHYNILIIESKMMRMPTTYLNGNFFLNILFGDKKVSSVINQDWHNVLSANDP